MENCVWIIGMLVFDSVLSLDFFPNAPHELVLGDQDSIARRGFSYLVVRPLKRDRQLVLTLPKDTIQMLNAEATSERGSPMLPTTLTLSFRNTLPQAARFHSGLMTENSEEENPKGRWNVEDLEGSSGGYVTVRKGQPSTFGSARKVKGSRGSTMKALKAVILEPKEIQSKRVRVVTASTENVRHSKGRFVKARAPMLTSAVKAEIHPVSFQKVTLSESKGDDWAASSVHTVHIKPPQVASSRHQGESLADLQCGGSYDQGWCDLGNNYPRRAVSQIMEVCEDLLSRMYVEVPISGSLMQASKNGTSWPWKEPVATFKKSLCQVQKNVIEPSFAQDIRGKWHVIIQTHSFPQRISLEICRNPGSVCEGCTSSLTQCVQKYSHQQLISLDPESAETCPYVRLYQFPTSCVCRIKDY